MEPGRVLRSPRANGVAALSPDARRNGDHRAPNDTPRGVRPVIKGKFFFVGSEKLWIRGVTYGAFLADDQGREYTDLAQVDRDFAQMAAAGVNAVRIPHTTPPRELLDIAQRHGLWVMVGLSAEQYAGFLVDQSKAPDIRKIIRDKVRVVAGHPALLCYGLGNEIQAQLARWIGRRRIERYLSMLCEVVRTEDPAALITYVNYPSTEYLSLPFLDFLSFNVYLESRERLSSYLARLQNLAGDRPLVMGELGLDSMRNGEELQAESLSWQVSTSFAEGCAGTFVFSWTDEWYRGKERVEDWAFGLTDADRKPKPALAAASRAFSEIPFPPTQQWPRVSVVVCTHNGAATLQACLEGVASLDYPDYEIIVVDDGSRDSSAAIASTFDIRLISTANMGLSSARNTGLQEATGEIIAYIDDDATPDRHWLKYLASSFETGLYGAVGGPNIAPGDEGLVANAVENSPGGPIHVLISDRIAEHIPGCNMAFRKDALASIGGFDTRFRTAGDDVDACWRILDAGFVIGFNAAAVVTHHRRKTLRAYWRQQWGYGRAEAALAAKWPEKYNTLGHITWGGRIYGKSLNIFRERIYHGVWGSAPYQQIHQQEAPVFSYVPLMPEWALLVIVLGLLAVLGLKWSPLLFALPLFAASVAGMFFRGAKSASFARKHQPRRKGAGIGSSLLTPPLFVLQPFARLGGRFRDGLTPWRTPAANGRVLPRPKNFSLWTSSGLSQHDRLLAIETALIENGSHVSCGSDFDRWDIQVATGFFGRARLLMAVEDHGGGHQFVRARTWPRMVGGLTIAGILIVPGFVAGLAAGNYTDPVGLGFWTAAVLIALRTIYDCAAAMASLNAAITPQFEAIAGDAIT